MHHGDIGAWKRWNRTNHRIAIPRNGACRNGGAFNTQHAKGWHHLLRYLDHAGNCRFRIIQAAGAMVIFANNQPPVRQLFDMDGIGPQRPGQSFGNRGRGDQKTGLVCCRQGDVERCQQVRIACSCRQDRHIRLQGPVIGLNTDNPVILVQQ